MGSPRGSSMLAFMLAKIDAWILGASELVVYRLATWSIIAPTFSLRKFVFMCEWGCWSIRASRTKVVMQPLSFASLYKYEGRRTLISTLGPGVACSAFLRLRPSHVVCSNSMFFYH